MPAGHYKTRAIPRQSGISATKSHALYDRLLPGEQRYCTSITTRFAIAKRCPLRLAMQYTPLFDLVHKVTRPPKFQSLSITTIVF